MSAQENLQELNMLSSGWNPSDVVPFSESGRVRSLSGGGNLYSRERRILNIKKTKRIDTLDR